MKIKHQLQEVFSEACITVSVQIIRVMYQPIFRPIVVTELLKLISYLLPQLSKLPKIAKTCKRTKLNACQVLQHAGTI